jgi:hypothetical protein
LRRAVLAVVSAALLAAVLTGCGGTGGSEGGSAASESGPGSTSPGHSAPPSAPSSDPSGQPGAAGAAASGSASPDAAAAPPRPSAPAGETPPAGSPAPAADVTAASGADGEDGLPLRVTVAPRCVERGGSLTVGVTTRADASIAAAAVFSDDDAHGAFSVGSADRSGRWTWRAAVAPDAPLGGGEVQVSAQDRSPGASEHEAGTSGEEAEAVVPFEVRRSC